MFVGSSRLLPALLRFCEIGTRRTANQFQIAHSAINIGSPDGEDDGEAGRVAGGHPHVAEMDVALRVLCADSRAMVLRARGRAHSRRDPVCPLRGRFLPGVAPGRLSAYSLPSIGPTCGGS